MDSYNNWRVELNEDGRRGVVHRIYEKIRTQIPNYHSDREVELLAAALEQTAYNYAMSQVDYLRIVSTKVMDVMRQLRSGQPQPTVPSTDIENPSQGGSQTETIESIKNELPVMKFSEYVETSGLKEDEEFVCAICLDCLEKDEEIRKLRNCSHVFHKECLDMWINHGKLNCPCCRCEL